MARQNHGPLSRAKGKLGGVVYQQYEGLQVAREYQPVVKNPQSEKQVQNRAKFKLASQITAEFAKVINARLAKLSIYKRARRGISVNAIYGAVVTTTPATPKVLVSNVVAAINAKSSHDLPAPSINSDQGAYSVFAPAGETVIYTIAAYNKTDGKLFGTRTESYLSAGTDKNLDLPAGYNCVVMAVSTQALTEEGRASISNITGINDGWENIITRGVSAGDLAISDIAGEYILGQ